MAVDIALKELIEVTGKDEKILWCGKPNKICLVLEAIFSPFLAFAIIWTLFDSAFFIAVLPELLSSDPSRRMAALPVVFFLLIHMTPVWVYIGSVVRSALRHKNTAYLITDKSIYISGGILTRTKQIKSYYEMLTFRTRRTFFDSLIGLGDVRISTPELEMSSGHYYINGRRRRIDNGLYIENIVEYQNVLKILEEARSNYINNPKYSREIQNAMRASGAMEAMGIATTQDYYPNVNQASGQADNGYIGPNVVDTSAPDVDINIRNQERRVDF